ncbi:uncharacterized protein ABH935_006632 [Catenulispora sp. GAS73]|uniref:FxsB family cyclophane-forming radical SAM/SPASM peptide maturase n=1 Tax=Catenulispora sp. GAS73 TaxID=3156269 RepID=UPI003519A04B
MAEGWPLVGLDVPRLRAAGVAPAPLSQFLVKIASRCNLACDYCYVYEHADHSWREASMFMSPVIARQAGRRMAAHAETYGIDRLRVTLHGGEPLLTGLARFQAIVEAIRAGIGSSASVDFTVQTNGTLLDERWLDLFDDLGVRVGVSLDGDPTTHDRHRRHASGQPSRADVERGIRLLAQCDRRHLFAGILSVIEVSSPPIEFFETVAAFSPPRLDLLLPHATWEHPPIRPPEAGPTPYADWLAAVFDHWYTSLAPVPVRLFEAMIDLLLDGESARPGGGELLGLAPLGYVIIDTDGSYKQSEALNLAYDGCSATGLSVMRHAVDDLLDFPGIVARQIGLPGLAPVCRSCEVVEVCGGGHYGHRYRDQNGFLNASVYCADLKALVEHVRARLQTDLLQIPVAVDGTVPC